MIACNLQPVMHLQTVAPNIAKAGGRTDPNAVVLGSLACLLDAPEWSGTPRRRAARLPADDVVVEVNVATFSEQVQKHPLTAHMVASSLLCLAQPPLSQICTLQ